MICRLFFIVFLLGLMSIQLNGQRYFSKIYPFEEGTHRFISIESLDTNLFWLQGTKWLPGFSSLSGYYYMDGQGNLVDSFFYETEGLMAKALPANNYIFKDDLIYQLYSYRDSENPHDIYVSSRSERDSVDMFPVDFQRPEWDRTFANTMTLYQDTIYIFGVGYIAGDPNTHDIFMIKMDLKGNMIWLKDLDQYHYFRSSHHIMSNVLEKDGFFYFTNLGDGPLGSHHNSRVYKVSAEGELVWRSALENEAVSSQSSFPDITFTADSSAIVWTNNRILYLEDVDNDWEVWQSKSYNPISLTLLDTGDGSFIEDYLYIIDSIGNTFETRNVITSRFNGDYIFCGIWENLYGDINQWSNPLIGRVSPSGEFKWVKLVADMWDDSFTAWSFFSVKEAYNEDLVLVGGTHRQVGHSGYLPAWVMRIGPNGCVPGHTYCNEDTLILNHPNVVVSLETPMMQRKDMQVYPNPLSTGQSVHLGFEKSGFPFRGLAEVKWISSDGRTMAEQKLTLVERAGYRTQVPPDLSPGLYFLEMRIGTESYVARVVVER